MAVTQASRVAGVAVDHDAREKDDFYPTPAEGTEALLRVEKFEGAIWEPACGDGAISRVLHSAGLATMCEALTLLTEALGNRAFPLELTAR